MDETLAYYDRFGAVFADSTLNIDFSEMRGRFTCRLKTGAHILDFGCGSGRDAAAFLRGGFCVTAVDGSAEMCRIASKNIGISVHQMPFDALDDISVYDGIWACASILHVKRDDLPEILNRMDRALVSRGVCYVSFKYGNFEGMRNGRYFNDMTETSFQKMLDGIGLFEINSCWITRDVRPERSAERWLNILMTKIDKKRGSCR